AGDFFAHSLVNEFSEGVFPAVADIVGGVPDGARELANGLRHLMMEDYFNQATPRFDANGERSLLPNGDISSDETPGIVFDAPTRFIYEALLKPFPEDPSARASTGRTNLRVAPDVLGRLSFNRQDGGDFLQEGFEVGMLVFGFGFTNAANNSKYRILLVDSNTMVVAPSFAQALKASPLVAESDADAGEAIATRGERGPILDVFFDLQAALDESAAALELTGALPLAPGQTAAEFFDDLSLQIAGIVAQGGTPTAQQVADLGKAYLRGWSEAIDTGVRQWRDFGLLP